MHCLVGLIVPDLTVPDGQCAAGKGGDIRLMGNEDDRDAAIPVQLLKERHDLNARSGIECARGLVGEDERRGSNERAGDGNALGLAAGQLRRLVVDALGKTNSGKRVFALDRDDSARLHT